MPLASPRTVHPGISAEKEGKSRLSSRIFPVIHASAAFPPSLRSQLDPSKDKMIMNPETPDTDIVIRSIVFDISEHDTTTGIRLIGLPTMVPDIRALINENSGGSGDPIAWEREEGDSHLFNLNFNWLDRSKDPKSWKLMTAVFKYMTESGWAMIKTTPWWQTQQFTLFFQFDPLLPKATIEPRDMFVIRFKLWNKISVMNAAGPGVLQCVRDAVSTHWKDRKG